MSRYRGFPPAERAAIVAKLLERDGRSCGICRADVDPSITDPRQPALVTIDHIDPVGAGGEIGSVDRIRNMQLAHQLCNGLRAKFPDHRPEWYARELHRALEQPPKAPKRERKAARRLSRD